MQETSVRSLGQEGMATHSSILAWRIPWTEEAGRLQSVGLKELDTTEQLTHTHTHTIQDRKERLMNHSWKTKTRPELEVWLWEIRCQMSVMEGKLQAKNIHEQRLGSVRHLGKFWKTGFHVDGA